MDDEMIGFLRVVLLSIGLMFGIFLVVAFGNYSIQNVPVKCYVEGKLVFDGRSACVDVQSSGANTTVKVRGGIFCVFPKEVYVSNNVRLEGKKHE